jgi:hypothetical protein
MMIDKTIHPYTFIFGNGISIINEESGWQMKYPDRNPIVSILKGMLSDDSLDGRVLSWIQAVEDAANTTGDEVFVLQISFASNTYLVRRALLGDDKLYNKIIPLLSNDIAHVEKSWRQYYNIIPDELKGDNADLQQYLSGAKGNKGIN